MIREKRRNLKLRRVWILFSFVFFWQIQHALPAEVGTGAKPADTEAGIETMAANGQAKDGRGGPVHGAGESAPGSLERLEQLVVKQSQEIEALRQVLRQQSERINQLEQREAATVPASFNASSGIGVTANGRVAALSSPSSASNATAGPQGASPAASDKDVAAAPLSIRIGKAEFTPGGFLDFTSIFRSTNVGSGIGTSFGAIPFSNTPQGRLSESRFSAQNSRLSLKATVKPSDKTSVTGYVEADFLGLQPPNGYVTSNANSFRMRLYWAQIQWGKWEVMGGQSWTLLTPNRVGLSPLPSDIFYSQNMDTNYQVGLTWSRDPQFRLIYHANKNWTAGVSFENPEQYVGGAVVLPSPLYASQLDGPGGNTNTPNRHPDIIAKIAFDGRPGDRSVHVEVAGLLRTFRIFNPATNGHDSTVGSGISVNTSLEVVRNLRLILTTYYSYGGGRYIFGLGPDLIVRPDGTLSLVHAGSGIAGFEYQANPNWMLYGYYGGAYFQRNFSIGPTGPVGFGFAGSPNSANRAVQEGTLGIIYTFWKKPEYGALQIISQYSYVTRSPWSVPVGTPGSAHTNMGYLNLRYVLP